ncbi:MAG: 50S ribosomal protein L24 [Burkholderiales bacterium]
MNRLRKGDDVVVIAGRDRARRGTVLRMVGKKVVVSGVNRVKKHLKPNPAKNISGGIVDREMPIDISNVALYNAAAKKAGRVGIRVLEDGRRVRYFKSNGEVLDA